MALEGLLNFPTSAGSFCKTKISDVSYLYGSVIYVIKLLTNDPTLSFAARDGRATLVSITSVLIIVALVCLVIRTCGSASLSGNYIFRQLF